MGGTLPAHPSRPHVRLTQHSGDSDEITTLIRSGEAELAYTVNPLSRQDIEGLHIGDGEVVLPPGWRTDFPDPCRSRC